MNFLRSLAKKKKKKLDDSSRLDVVEIARVPDMLPSFSFLVGLRTYQHPGIAVTVTLKNVSLILMHNYFCILFF